MTNQVNIANFQQKFIINVDAKTAKQVPVEQRQILTQAYMKLFSGFAWVNWTQKHSLGRAWQTALNQCASMVATKNKKNPAARYLNNVCDAHKKYWSRIIMLNPNSENTIDKNENYVKKMRMHGQMMIKQAMDTINVILARYNEFMETIEAQQKPKQKAQERKPAQQRPAPVRATEKPVVQKQQNTNHKENFAKGQQKVKMLQVKLRVIRIAQFKQAGIMRGFGQQRA